MTAEQGAGTGTGTWEWLDRQMNAFSSVLTTEVRLGAEETAKVATTIAAEVRFLDRESRTSENPVRAFRNAIAHSNWTDRPGSVSLMYWARKGESKDEPMVDEWEVTGAQLDFWQALSRTVAYAAYTSLQSVVAPAG